MEYEEPINPQILKADEAWWQERDEVRESYFEAVRALVATLKQDTEEEKKAFCEALMELQIACSQALEKANERREMALKALS